MNAKNEKRINAGVEVASNTSPPPTGVTAEVASYILGHLNRITMNLARVEHLITVSEIISPPGTSSKSQVLSHDLLRAAVVFLHATLEDFLRYVGMMYLPHADEDSLNHVALVGSMEVIRPEKFFLGKLAQHRGKTIDEVIRESVSAQLDRTSFSDVRDIARLLESIGIKAEHCVKHFPELAELTTRRHKIVHRGDLVEGPIHEPREVNAITSGEVTKWKVALEEFVSGIIAEKIGQEFGPRMLQEKQRARGTSTAKKTPAAKLISRRSIPKPP